ncbi:MAG: RraA family protein [Verrucomicrobiota bacterium]
MKPQLSTDLLAALRRLDTCTVANAVERLETRLRNEGYMAGTIRCLTPGNPPLVGFAVTVKMRCSSPPPLGERSYLDRTDWWQVLEKTPAPRVVVVEDVEDVPGRGSLVGAVHCAVLRSLGCVGVITNGAVRDVAHVRTLGFGLFAGSLCPSHAYAHIVSVGDAVRVGGLVVRTGDLLHGDEQGVVNVPLEKAVEIPRLARGILAQERRVLEHCQSPEFSVRRLAEILASAPVAETHSSHD